MLRRRTAWIGAVTAVQLALTPCVLIGGPNFPKPVAQDLNPAAPQNKVVDEARLPREDTTEVVVLFHPGADVARFAQTHALTVTHQLKSNQNAYVLKAESEAAARGALWLLGGDHRVRFGGPNERRTYKRMAFVPDDPYFHKDTPSAGFPGQWHLLNEHGGPDAGVAGAWNRDVTGSTVIVGVVDDGLEHAHEDLGANYVAADSFDFGQNDPDPSPVGTDRHGTAVSGVAASRGGNAIGTTGAAPHSGVAGLRIDFDNQTAAMFADATMYHSSGGNTNIRVKNHSYGIPSSYVTTTLEKNALAVSAASGTIHVFAAGNERGKIGEDSGKQDNLTGPDAIAVAALGSDGTFASYSSFGANVFVTAPSNSSNFGAFEITTTDNTGSSGYNTTASGSDGDSFPDLNYTSTFGGTSSASPLVAGVMALGASVQPNLDLRFAKHLLVLSSDIVDAADSTTTSDGGWKTNAAGHSFNQNYGFGLINADVFTQLATQFSGVPPLLTQSTDEIAVGAAIPENNLNGIDRTFEMFGMTPLEEVMVTLDITHTYRGDLEAILTSPLGTQSRLMLRNIGDFTNNLDWTFLSNAFWGEDPLGLWTLKVRDVFAFDFGTWNNFSVTAHMGALIQVPEPATAGLLGLGVVLLSLRRVRGREATATS